MKTFQGEQMCVCVLDASIRSRRQILQHNKFCELRTDLCGHSPKILKDDLNINSNVIVSFRPPISISKVLGLIDTAIQNGAAAIDLDLTLANTLLEKNALGRLLLKNNLFTNINLIKDRQTLIISYHDYTTTPPLKDLKKTVRECKRVGDKLRRQLGNSFNEKVIVKIATKSNNMEEANRMLELYNQKLPVDNEHLISISMGKMGIYTRAAIISLGAPLTYCRANVAAAEGQLTRGELKNILYPLPVFGIGNTKYKNTSEVSLNSSKSIAQRALLLSAFAKGISILENFYPKQSENPYSSIPNDTHYALKFIDSIGASIAVLSNQADNQKVQSSKKNVVIDESNNNNENNKEKENEKENSKKDDNKKNNKSENKNNRKTNGTISVNSSGFENWETVEEINCGESAFLARCAIALAATTGMKVKITGHGSLLRRDLSSSIKIVNDNGGRCSFTALSASTSASTNSSYQSIQFPIIIDKPVSSRDIVIDGAETSQDISGYLMALPLMGKGGRIIVKNIVSSQYIELTLNMMRQFGVEVNCKKGAETIFTIAPNQNYKPANIYIENDWSSAANLLIQTALRSNYKKGAQLLGATALNIDSIQPDTQVIKILKKCGCKITTPKSANGHHNIYLSNKELKNFKIDCTSTPDLIPITTVLALFCNGKSEIKGVDRLINKESNRASALITEILRAKSHIESFTPKSMNEKIGIHIKNNSFIVNGPLSIKGASNLPILSFSTYNDHRIAMAIAIMLQHILNLENAPTNTKFFLMESLKCVDKSFPEFQKLF